MLNFFVLTSRRPDPNNSGELCKSNFSLNQASVRLIVHGPLDKGHTRLSLDKTDSSTIYPKTPLKKKLLWDESISFHITSTTYTCRRNQAHFTVVVIQVFVFVLIAIYRCIWKQVCLTGDTCWYSLLVFRFNAFKQEWNFFCLFNLILCVNRSHC